METEALPESGRNRPRAARVMIVAPRVPPYGGMALQAELLARLLQQDGHAVTFFASNFPLPAAVALLQRAPGVRTIVRYLLTWPMLWRRAGAVEIVHVLAASWLYFFAVVTPAVIVGKLRRKRVVLNYRGGDARRFLRRWRRLAAPVFRAADVVTVPSRFLSEVIGPRCGVAVEIVGNIVDQSIFRFQARDMLQPRLIVARSLEDIYDIETVLKAFRVIRQRRPDACLGIAGSGSREGRLREMAGRWGLQGVSFLGPVSHDDLPGVYSSYDIFINGSRVDNFPGALVEASASGLALVSTAAGGIPFLYEHERDALLVAPGDWQGLADAVERLLASPALARRLAANGLALARSCEWKSVRGSVYAAYGLSSGEARRACLSGRI